MFKKGVFLFILISIISVNLSITISVFASDYYTGVHFDTAETGVGNVGDITTYNDFFWIVDEGGDEVYKYNPDGTYTGVSFDTAGSGANKPTGIVAYNDFFWITDPADNEVYKYNPDGTYTTVSFDTTASGAADATGITAYGGFLWIVDAEDDEVYKYNPDGTYTSVSFDIAGGGGSNNPSGVVAYNDFFWVFDNSEYEVYKYETDGTYTGLHFDISSESSGAQGITAYNDFFWIWSSNDQEVYKYTTTEAVAPTISSLSPIDGATSASTIANLVITFNEYADSATGNVTIYKSSDNSIVEAIDVEGGQVTGEGTTIITINPSVSLSQSTSYYIQIDATTFEDLAGNSFAGIADTTTWNFTTGSAVHDGIERVSINSDEEEGDAESYTPSISADGNYVVFYSSATNLVPDDENGQDDIFLRDIALGTTTRVSVSSDEEESNGGSYNPSISSNGNYVVFESYATNLVADDTNGTGDIFLRDIALGTTTRISISSDEEEGDANSDDSFMSSNGNYIVFESEATNLIADDTNGTGDIFLRDIALGTTTRISVSSDEVEGDEVSSYPSISSDGNYVVFSSSATNLVPNDENGLDDIFLRDISLGTTTRISISSDEVEGDSESSNPYISSDGNYVVFSSSSTNLVADDTNDEPDIFLRGIALGTTTRISMNNEDEEGDGESYSPFISSDGQYIAFLSDATNLVSNDTNEGEDVFLYDRENDTIQRISVDDDGNEIFESSVGSRPVISEDSQYIAFDFSNEGVGLVEDDANDIFDTFVVYFDRGIEEEEEPEPEEDAPRTSSSGSTARSIRNNLVNNTPSLGPNTPAPKDCISTYKFSPSTGLPCTNPNFIFNTNLYLNLIHPDVKELQKYLNTHGFVLAAVGPGSPGLETTKFGALTKAGVIKFQLANNITPAVGFFGPITRGVVNGN